MSKNHPHDNIYSILGKLDALKPTQEETRFALVKEIRESVEAQGSILSGVDAVQAKLQQQFNEAGQRRGMHGEPEFVGIPGPAKGTKPSPKAITKGADREYYKSPGLMGEPERTRWRKKTAESCNACEEGTCEDHMNEAEITRKPGVTTHRKTDFPGYPVDEPEGIDDENKGKRGRPRKHAAKVPTGLGRGRPKKAAPVGATAPKMHDPFGRVSHSASKLSGAKGRIHSMDEAMALVKQNLQSTLTEGRLIDESGETLDHILNRFKHDVKRFEAGEDIYNTDLYHALFDYYSENGEMPYGTQKARDGDPVEFIHDRLDMLLADKAYGKDPANAEGYGIEDEGIEQGIGNDIVNQHEKMKALTPQKPGVMGAIKDVAQGAKNWIQGKPETGPTYEDTALEEELNELAKLAGLKTEGNAFSGKLANTAKGDSFEHDGETFTNRSSIADESAEEEGSPQADQDYDNDGEVESEKDEVIGSRRKAAGLDEAKVEVDEPEDDEEVENKPKPKYGTIKQITTQGDDLNRQKKQDPHTANKAANPFTNEATMTLEAELMAEYESIKKIS